MMEQESKPDTIEREQKRTEIELSDGQIYEADYDLGATFENGTCPGCGKEEELYGAEIVINEIQNHDTYEDISVDSKIGQEILAEIQKDEAKNLVARCLECNENRK